MIFTWQYGFGVKRYLYMTAWFWCKRICLHAECQLSCFNHTEYDITIVFFIQDVEYMESVMAQVSVFDYYGSIV